MKEMGYRSMEYTKVQQQMNDIVGDNVKKLAQLFPAAVKDGEVDFEALKEELGQFQEVGSEKYELTWAGKKNAKKIAQEDVVGRTLKFIPEDSKDAETTENLYIEGDNLEVLKLLRQNYYGAVKMIYIDPPYNTGNDFVYNDSFEMNDDEIKENDESFSGFGEKYSINSDTQSRYHANWISMMYPRLKVAKDLLRDDGVIFISIDDNEMINLKGICNEIFGEENFIEQLIWKRRANTPNDRVKSLVAIEELQPLFTLRYSATHKQLYNQIYKLDSYAAYQKDLVKKIVVKTVYGVIPKDYPYVRYLAFTSDLKARIEMFSQDQGGTIRFKTFNVSGGTSLEELSGGLFQYKDYRIAEEPHKLKPLSIATKNGFTSLEMGHSNHEIEKNEAVRIQIRLAIQNHFAKQFNIIRSGRKIKALTLFFIDEVSKVRDESAPDGRGEYLRIFDEEYKRYITTHIHELEKNKEYFPDYINVQAVREGYFARDKKNNAVNVEGWDSSVDDSDVKLKAKSQEDIDRGISLILEKKDELISFEEPLAFIFSHSALREGWDNPNVFTLCTLKAGGSDIAKKQEIGRGLRLPVDDTGNRCIDRKINELMVIANDYYDHFASALQKDFNDNMHFVKDEVTADILIETLKLAGVPEEKISPVLVDTLKEELVSVGVMNSDKILKGSPQQIAEILDNMFFVDDTLNEHAQLIKQQFKELMVQKGTRKIEIVNGDNASYDNYVRAYVTEGEFEKIYLGLRKNLMKRSIYRFKINKDAFIEDCIFQIDQSLLFKQSRNEYKIKMGRGKFDTSQKFVMKEASYGDKELEVEISSEQKSDFEIANFIMYHTMLPRLAIFKIIKGIMKRGLLNDQDILDDVTQLILRNLNDTKASNITSYEVINGYELDERNIFEMDTITEADFEQEWRVFKARSDRSSAMNEYYKLDSEGESQFAHKLENNENVLLFTKLKKGGFVIDTPYGNYSPDWAVVCRKDALKDSTIGIYFIVETKAGKTWEDLTQVERNKIRCGELHFKAVSNNTKFDWVNGYEDFVNKFGVFDSNKGHLSI